MEKSNYSSVKECDAYDTDNLYEFSAGNYDIPKGDIFDPLVQKLIAKRCEDRGFNMLFELEEPYKEDIKYVVFTYKGWRLYFTSKCKEMALNTLTCDEIKALRIKNDYYYGSNTNMMYMVYKGNDVFLLESILYSTPCEVLFPQIAMATIREYEKVLGLAELTLTSNVIDDIEIDDIEIEDSPNLLDVLKEEPTLRSRPYAKKPEYGEYIVELLQLGINSCLCINRLKDEPATNLYFLYLTTCPGDNYQVVDILLRGLDLVTVGPYTVIGDNKAKDAEACKLLLVGYNELYQLQGYQEYYSQLFAFSRVLSTKSFPEDMLFDCYKEVFDGDRMMEDAVVIDVLSLYK